MWKKGREREKMMLIFTLGVFVWGALIFWRGYGIPAATNTLLSEIGYKYLRMEQISQLLSGEYYDKEEFLSGQKNMIENATKAFVDGLGDPYTSYLDAEQFSGLQTELEGEGQIEGIWAVVGKKIITFR